MSFPGPTSEAGVLSAEPTPQVGGLLQSFRHRWLLASLCGIALGAAAFAVAWVVRPPAYTASAYIKVASGHTEVLPQSRGSATDQDANRQTQAALIKSDSVLTAAINDPEVQRTSLFDKAADKYSWLEASIATDTVKQTELIKISMSGQEPEELALIVNVVAEAYLEEIVNREQRQRQTRIDDIRRICEESERKLTQQQKAVSGSRRLTPASKQDATALSQRLAVDEYAAIRKEYTDAAAALRKLQQASTKTAEKRTISSTVVDSALDEHPEVIALSRDIAFAESNVIRTQTEDLRGDSKALKIAHSTLDGLNKNMTTLRNRLRQSVADKLQKRADIDEKNRFVQQREEEEQLKQQLVVLADELKAKRKDLESLTGTESVHDEPARAKLDESEKVIRSLWAEYDRLEIENQSNFQRITLEVKATPPTSKSMKAALQTSGMMGALGLIIGAGGVSYLEMQGRRIRTRSDVTAGLGLKLLGALPIARAKQPQVHFERTYSKYENGNWSEALAGIRTALLHTASRQSLRSVLVTSASQGEGKTTLSTHLAINLAASGYRTLIIDADLRRPSIHRIFDLAISPGLIDLISGQSSIAEVVRATSTEGLAVIPAGECYDAFDLLLQKGSLSQISDSLRHDFDFIIVDAPPVLPVNDTLIVGQQIDTVLLSIRKDRSRLPDVRRALEKLASLNITVLGSVLNGSESIESASRYEYDRLT